jgi:CubicO group peptidase (beta-lactamase class C family)
MRKLFTFLFFLNTVFVFSGCTFTKIVVFFKPDNNDHEKAFVCDTIPSSENLKSCFVNAHDPGNIPPINKWINIRQRLKATDFNDFLDKSNTTALLVIKNDSILYENYLKKGAKDRTQMVFSVTKGFAATLVAVAAEEGLLSIDQKVADFIPEFGEDERKDITLRHLMGMVSGLNWNDFKNLPRLGGLYYNNNQQKFVVRNVKQEHLPETKFVYKSVSTQILGICLEKATGKSFADYMNDKIWKHIGAEYDVLVTLDSKKNRNARTFGGMAMTANDMARFGKLMLNDGIWNGERLVPQWFLKELRNRDMNNWIGYSNCFWRNGYENKNFQDNQQFWAAGYGGQYIYVSPKENMIIVRTGTNENNRWSVLLGRLSAQISSGKTDLSDSSMDFGEQFAGTFINDEGKEMKLELLPEKDKYQRREWLWSRDTDYYKEAKELKTLTQFDGISLGFKKKGVQTRMYYKVKDDKVLGFYYNTWPEVKFNYFEKVD